MPPGDAYTWLDTPTKDKGDTEPTGPTSVAPAADSTTTPVSLHALAVELLRHGSEAQAAAAKGVAAAGGGAAGPSRGSSRDKVVAVVAMVLLQVGHGCMLWGMGCVGYGLGVACGEAKGR